MDSFHGVKAGSSADSTALPHTSFPTNDEIDVYVREAHRLRAEMTAAGLTAVLRTLAKPLRAVGGAIYRWNRRMQLKQMLMSRSDWLLADIGAKRDNIDAFLRGERLDSRPVEPPLDLWRILPHQVEINRQARQERKRIEDELNAYTDSELDDIGIHRADIPEIARSGHKVAA